MVRMVRSKKGLDRRNAISELRVESKIGAEFVEGEGRRLEGEDPPARSHRSGKMEGMCSDIGADIQYSVSRPHMAHVGRDRPWLKGAQQKNRKIDSLGQIESISHPTAGCFDLVAQSNGLADTADESVSDLCEDYLIRCFHHNSVWMMEASSKLSLALIPGEIERGDAARIGLGRTHRGVYTMSL
jgi:hypothetical protein